jgi:hypothetical protein
VAKNGLDNRPLASPIQIVAAARLSKGQNNELADQSIGGRKVMIAGKKDKARAQVRQEVPLKFSRRCLCRRRSATDTEDVLYLYCF